MSKTPKGGSQRYVEWKQGVENLIDSYPYGVTHGLQKDAIQNAWDAKVSDNPELIKQNWQVSFELSELKGKEKCTCLVIQDQGTCGLIGEMTSDDIDEDTTLSENERWARFEALYLNPDDQSRLGSRG